MTRKIYFLLALLLATVLPSHAMHIMEGYLPLGWCIFWYAVSLPFVLMSFRAMARLIQGAPRERITIALNVAFVFILSALKLPSVTGSSSHLTGTTLGTLCSGMMAMPLVGAIVLLFQALLLAHGGLSTLGANVFSLAVAGPLVAYIIYIGVQRMGASRSVAIFLAAMIGSLATYVTTSLQLAIVFPDSEGGFLASLVKFMGIFSVTQVPLSVLEGVMTLAVMRLVERADGSEERIIVTPSKGKIVALSLGAVLCLLAPLASSWVDFGEGADDRAGAMVESLAPRYDTAPLIEAFEPSEAAEPWLFTLQVGIGIALFAWGIYIASKRKAGAS